jgi:FtsH-binding integral membrane protein
MANTSLYNSLFHATSSSSMMKGGGFNLETTFKIIQEKKTFLIMVFSNLIVQLGITYYILVNTDTQVLQKKYNFHTYSFFAYIPAFILIIVMNFPMPSWLRFIFFSMFSAYMGILLNFWEKLYGLQMMKAVIFSVIGIFVSLIVFAVGLLTFGIQISNRFGIVLLFALLLLIISKIIFMVAGTYITYSKAFAIIGVGLFAIYILYDTHQILQRNYYGDFVTASLDYYLDFINIVGSLLNYNSN